jgi:hypothetical protein
MIAYRLGDHRIVDDEDGELRWESYAGFGRTMSGKCFVAGNILFLEPSREINENSYLLLEYHEFLDKLPRWEKTKYYCSSYTIRTCETGGTPSGNEISSRSQGEAKEVSHTDATEVTGSVGIRLKQSAETGSISYRLGQYEVVENENGEVSWKTHAGLGHLKRGMCFVKDGILFMGESSKVDLKKPGEPGFLRKQFLEDLSQLPRWERTRYYCTSYTIRSCETGRTLSHKMTSERSRDRRENSSQDVTGGNLTPLKRFPPRYDGDTDFKEHINTIKGRIVSAGVFLLFSCTAFCAKFFHRRRGEENGRDHKSGNR